MITIKKNFEFRRVLSRGKNVNGSNIAIYFFPNKLNLLRFEQLMRCDVFDCKKS